MKSSEKILLGAVGLLVGGLGLQYGWNELQSLYETRRDRIAAIEEEISGKKMVIFQGERALRKMSAWEAAALPAEVERADSLYQSWLLGVVKNAKLTQATVDPGRAVTVARTTRERKREEVYQALPFTLRARGTLEQLTRFLYDFHRAPHLQQVKRISAKPVEPPGTLDLQMVVEALALPGADRVDRLAEGNSDRLAGTTVDDFVKPITQRNLFAPYVAPPPPPPPRPPVVAEAPRPAPPRPPSFDEAKFAVVTGVVQVDDAAEAWILVRTSGKTLRLRAGESFEIGQAKGKITEVGSEDLVVEFADGRRLVGVGESLREGVKLGEGDL
ncbi:MAG TPA: hypothetical protein VGE52_20845 [Pirellulales bacterium]